MKIAILEYIVGGGLAHHPLHAIPESLAKEGMAMLCSVLRDVERSDLRACCCIDARFQSNLHEYIHARSTKHRREVSNSLQSVLDGVTIVDATKPECATWLEVAQQADAALVIAPESDGVLRSLVQKLREHGVLVLASDDEFLKVTSDKLLTAQAFAVHGVRHPPTMTLEAFLDSERRIADFGIESRAAGWLLKRRDGAGCEGMRCVSSIDQLKDAWIDRTACDWIVQPWIEGPAASVAVCCGPFERVILPPCSQRILRTSSVSYNGGTAPYWPVSEKRLNEFVESVFAALPGQPLGWIGIDWLYDWESDQCVVIEVNPRITTSVVGLCYLFETSLIENCVRIALGLPNRLVPNPNRVEWSAEGELHGGKAE